MLGADWLGYTARGRYLIEQSKRRYQLRTGHAPEALRGEIGYLNGMRIVKSPSVPEGMAVLGFDLAAPGGDKTVVWNDSFVMFMHPDPVPIPNWDAHFRRLDDLVKGQMVNLHALTVPLQETPVTTATELTHKRAAMWRSMREWVATMAPQPAAQHVAEQVVRDGVLTGRGITRTCVDLQGNVRSQAVPAAAMFIDESQDNERAQCDAGADQHHNQE